MFGEKQQNLFHYIQKYIYIYLFVSRRDVVRCADQNTWAYILFYVIKACIKCTHIVPSVLTKGGYNSHSNTAGIAICCSPRLKCCCIDNVWFLNFFVNLRIIRVSGACIVRWWCSRRCITGRARLIIVIVIIIRCLLLLLLLHWLQHFPVREWSQYTMLLWPFLFNLFLYT